MNIGKKLVLLAVIITSLGVVSAVVAESALAQTCTGSVQCKRYGLETSCDGGINDGESCSVPDDCFGGSCETQEVVTDRDTKSCSDPYLGCRAGCQNEGVGWVPDGGGCTEVPPPPPPPPPAVRYSCNTSTYSCYNAGSSGYYASYSSCDANCNPGAPPPPEPEPDPDPPTCTTCGCPGQPVCQCSQEQQCGNITQWDCCAGACVPEGTSCCAGGGCGGSCISTYDATNVWLRVVSNDGPTGTTAWKGSQANDPIVGTNWTVSGLDADGYFQTYKPYENGSNKTFDKTKNKIDSQMRVTVNTAPNGPYTYVNECEESVTSNIPSGPAHGIAWSNHFCAGGWAWEALSNGLYPNKNQSSSGDLYYTEMAGSSSDLFPRPDVDGCWGLMMSPNDSNETVRSYHESLVPMLQLADANHWADLKYDEYWSMAYQAWEYYDNTKSLESIITIAAPANRYCMDVRWWGDQAQDEEPQEYNLGLTSNADGSCTIRFNPKKYDNLIVAELSPALPDERCTVQLENPYTNPNVLASDITVSKKSDFVAHVTGYSTEPTAPLKEKVNLWIANDDFSKINAWEYIDGTGKRWILENKFEEIISGGKYYYRHSDPTGLNQQCYTNADAACSMSVNITDSTMALFGQDILPADDYHVFCDVTEPSSICSGNPTCTMNGGSTACYGYNDCTPDTSTPFDHATVTSACVSSCTANACNATSYVDECGYTCAADPNYGAPPAPTLSEPDQNLSDVITPGTNGAPANYYNIQWSNSSTLTDSYDILAYPQGSFATPDDALTAYVGGGQANLIYYTTQPVGVSSLNIPVLSGQNWKMRLAIRAKNTGPCSPMNSGWTTADFDLIGSVSGNIQAVSSNTCSGGTTITNGGYPDVGDGTTVTTSDDSDQISNFSLQTANKGFGVYGNIVNGSYSVNFLPFDPPMWHTPPVLKTRLNIVNLNRSQTYVCALCNRESLFTCFTGASGATNVSSSSNNFYVQLYDLSNISWWQSWGGNSYGKNGLYSAVPASCNSGVGCNPIIIADLPGANTLNSAGVPISSAAISNAGGYYSENDLTSDPTDGNPRGQNTTGNFAPVLENYTHFISDTDLPIPASANSGAANVVINTPITTRAQFKTAFGSNFSEVNNEVIAWVPNGLTIDLTAGTANWDVPAGERWLVFVPGDITLTGPSDHSLNAQQYLIKVQTGGFLSFVAGGDITFNENLGYGYDDDTDLSGFITPIVEGVFIASDTLTVKSKGGNTPGDYKFVGAGSYIGWTGLNLERKFDNNITRSTLNNNSPSELIIYRPDFMATTPEFMKKSAIDWREVN